MLVPRRFAEDAGSLSLPEAREVARSRGVYDYPLAEAHLTSWIDG